MKVERDPTTLPRRSTPASASRAPSLGPRLEAIASLIRPGRPLIDIGTDHARLPAILLAEARIPQALGTDKRHGPLREAQRTLERLACGDRLILRKGDGLRPILDAELEGYGTLVIAGMGGASISKIVEDPRLKRFRGRIVLQPNARYRALASLRCQLHNLGWSLVSETLARERGTIYIVMAAERSSSPPPLANPLVPRADIELQVSGPIDDLGRPPLHICYHYLGPCLNIMSPPHPLYGAWLRQEHRANRQVLSQACEDEARHRQLWQRLLDHQLDALEHDPRDGGDPSGMTCHP